MDIVIKNARIVLHDEVIKGCVEIRNGVIVSVDPGPSALAGAVDFGGDYLLPGFVELHTDNLEQELEPRPDVFWPHPLASVLAHDATMVSSGITTVLDAVSLGEYHDGPKRAKILDMSLKALRKARKTGVLKVDHRLHLRCEYSDPKVLEMLGPNIDDETLLLVSLMDHTPGQRQFTDPAFYRNYFKKQNWSDEEFVSLTDRLVAVQGSCAADNRRMIVQMCQERQIPLASHDDTTPEHVEQAVIEGIDIAEFPTSLVAASLARKAGIRIVMGGPNVVRGGSHSGNVAAHELAAEGLLDILSSDYVPGSLLWGAFTLHHDHGLPLPEAVNKISLNPAQAVGLVDRGEIRAGLRGDVLRVREVEDLPVVLQTWSMGCDPREKLKARNAA